MAVTVYNVEEQPRSSRSRHGIRGGIQIGKSAIGNQQFQSPICNSDLQSAI
jgi:hypothetical protein